MEFKPTDEVRFKAEPDKTAIVMGAPFRQGAVWFVQVRVLSAARALYNAPIDALELIVQAVSGRERLLAGEFLSLRYLRARLTYEKLANPLRDVLYSLRAARTDFLPHQFKPVLKFLESPANGLLIADEVGLGKTIEAGYILKELRARQRMTFRRVLVVCPAGLRIKWMQEMNRRFGESFEIADARKIRETVAKIENDGERAEFALVTSYQTLRSASLKNIVEGLGPINLTIVDEAHHFRNPATQTHDLAEVLREISENLLFLSATPVQLGDHNLHALLRLLAPDHVGDYHSFSEQFKANRSVIQASRTIVCGEPNARDQTLQLLDELLTRKGAGVPLNAVRVIRERVAEADLESREAQLELRSEIRELSPLSTLMTRTRKREVSDMGPRREAWLPVVNLTEDERAVYDFFTSESRRSYGGGTANRQQQASRFRSVSLQQQMASCLPAFLRSRCMGEGGLVEYGDLGELDDVDVDGVLSDEMMEIRASKIREVEEVTASVDRILKNGIDSKLAQLLEIIERVHRANPTGKLIVFSFYKATLRYLFGELKKRGIIAELISGDIPSSPENPEKDLRARRVERFHKDPTVRVLLSSEVGSEGLDFQEASNVVVHYDLPWNPMKVEQRIGRVDRHLQPHPIVYTVSFAIPGTIEDRIRTVLYERIGVFRETIGDLEEIIATELHKIEHVVMSPELNEKQREEQLEVIAAALVNQAANRRQLEEQAGRLMGHDDTFDQELAVLEKSGRSVAAEELADFIEGALESDGIRVTPVYGKGKRSARIDDTGRLQDFLRKNVPKGMWGRIPLLSERSNLPVQLDYIDSKAVHFVTAHHALAHAALELRKRSLSSADEPVVAIRLKASEVRSDGDAGLTLGKYAFAMARLNDIGSFRNSYSIVGISVGFDGKPLLQSVGEQLIQSALSQGENAHGFTLAEDDAVRVVDALESEIAFRRGARERVLREREARSHDMRLESQRSNTESKLRRVVARTEAPEFYKKEQRYQNMTLGSKKNLEDELNKIELSFRHPVPPTVTHELFGYGLIEVVR